MGSTRWAGYTSGAMPALLARAGAETIVLAQIEEPEGVEAADAIAAIGGIDGLFIGPSGLSVAYGHGSPDKDDLPAAMVRVGEAGAGHGDGDTGARSRVARRLRWAHGGLALRALVSCRTAA